MADSVVTMVAQRKESAIGSVASYPLSLRLENALASYTAYLWKAVWPAHLSIFYPYPSHGFPAWQMLLSTALLVGVSFVVWRKRLLGYPIVGWCWFLGMMVPVIGLIQVGEQGMADRYAYLPLVGIFVVTVWGASDLLRKAGGGAQRLAAAATAIALVLLSTAAWRQVRLWRSNLDLWSHAAAVTQNNSSAETVVGSLLLVDALNGGAHYSDEAQAHFQRALQINPKDSEARFDIGNDLSARGRPQEAIQEFSLALQDAPGKKMKSQILSEMASAYDQLGDFDKARKYYSEAMQISSGADQKAFVGFARTFTDEKIANLAAQLVLHPTAAGYLQLARVQASAGHGDAAVSSYQRAFALDPKAREQAVRDAVHP
jgi:protein O-mannosyl-transferase